MPGHEEFEKFGDRDPHPKNTPDECDDCQYFEVAATLPGFWDTVRDAAQIYAILRGPAAHDAWKKLWDDFKCPPPGKECKIRKACSTKPTFLNGVADLKLDPKDKVPRWVVTLILGRKIKCIAEGTEKDVDLEMPKPPGEKGKEPETPKPDKPGK